MTYEEKLEEIVKELVEAKKRSRVGQHAKIFVTKQSELTKKIIPQELHEILLQLQDDEKILIVKEIPSDLKSGFDIDVVKLDYFLIEFLKDFDDWYEGYILRQQGRVQIIDWINLLKALDVSLDINEKLQISRITTIGIPTLPQLVRFQLLFPVDSVGNRRNYQEYRREGLQYLANQSAIKEFRFVEESSFGYGDFEVFVDLIKFEELFKELKAEYNRRNEMSNNNKRNDDRQTYTINEAQKAIWSEDFVWDEKDFIFGKFGKITFVSNDRMHLFKILTEKKGNWATVKELSGNKDSNYVRSTIKQIEDKLSESAKKHIRIVSTQEDSLEPRPSQGAYRIKYLP